MLYKYTVFCEIIQLRRAGLRLAPKNWPEPVKGDLHLYPIDGQNHLRRALRFARLIISWGTTTCPGPQLFDPIIIEVLGDGMLWRGYETVIIDEGLCEHEQLWIVRPRASLDGPLLPKFDAAKFSQKLPEVIIPSAHIVSEEAEVQKLRQRQMAYR